MRTTLVLLVFVAMAALASKVDAKTWEEDDMIIVEGKFGRRSVIQLVHVGESPILARSRVATMTRHSQVVNLLNLLQCSQARQTKRVRWGSPLRRAWS